MNPAGTFEVLPLSEPGASAVSAAGPRPLASAADYAHPWGEPRSSLQPALAELARFFRAYRVWFNQKLPEPVITLQSSGGGRRSLSGWHAARRWEQAHLGRRLDELNLCPEHLGGGPEAVGHALIHEMVHYANARLGVCDGNANQYHNGHFKRRAEEVGLDCGTERHPRFGWGLTRLTDAARQRIAAIRLDPAAFLLFRHPPPLDPVRRAAARPKLRKWVCACDGLWRAAGKPPLQAQCLACRQPFRPA
jgi:hypothetical protein